MLFDLDRYYTPSDVAQQVLADNLDSSPRVCVDSTCGSGRLLEAANSVFGRVECVGLDRDKNAIENLRRRNPHWVLSVADLMNSNSYNRTVALSKLNSCDLLVLNPPFSHGKRKSVSIDYKGEKFKGSIAMAHILKSFELFDPVQGAIIIVPESLLYSETDALAREILLKEYSFEKIIELKNCTFRGARAHATAIKMVPGTAKSKSGISFSLAKGSLAVRVIRGGLAVHKVKRYIGGVPYIHSTDIRDLSIGKPIGELSHTRCEANGRLSGWIILIPRVGMPDKESVKVNRIREEIQLSDCVIALSCSSKKMAYELEDRIRRYWSSFERLYRGTGARYITLARLELWLTKKGVRVI